MSVTFKDIDDYTQKSSVAGTEKIPVSDTEYITPSQIVGSCLPKSGGTMDADATVTFPDSDGYYDTVIAPTGVTVSDSDDSIYIAVDATSGGVTISEDSSIYGSGNFNSTRYGIGIIENKSGSGSGVTLDLPTSSGTIALTSDIPTIRTGTTDPSSNLGSDGDIYLKLSS